MPSDQAYVAVPVNVFYPYSSKYSFLFGSCSFRVITFYLIRLRNVKPTVLLTKGISAAIISYHFNHKCYYLLRNIKVLKFA